MAILLVGRSKRLFQKSMPMLPRRVLALLMPSLLRRRLVCSETTVPENLSVMQVLTFSAAEEKVAPHTNLLDCGDHWFWTFIGMV